MSRFIVWAILAAAPLFTAVAHATSCSDDEVWRCRDGTCITLDEKCDGKFDCPDRSDESHAGCRKHFCPPSRFRCAYGACVDGTAPCDGREDCADGSDELMPQCRKKDKLVDNGEFTCYQDGNKIPAYSLCDGVKDCTHGDDELLKYCGGKRCAPGQFQCAYGACVNPNSECNEDLTWDCADGSDEADFLCNRTTVIGTPTTSRPVIAPCDGFRCSNGVCMANDLRCNGAKDCQFGEDEEECDAGKCRGDEWTCRDGSCISMDKKCDGKFDCSDHSDESHPACWEHYCPLSRFRCAYGACVDGTAPCDGREDCADGSDELMPQCRKNKLVDNGEFTCFQDGNNIPANKLCDGVKDCTHGDDELLKYCGGKRCRAGQFQCAYGACVDPQSDCNEDLTWHCADGSDEADYLCNRTTIIETPTTNPPVIGPCDGFRCSNGVCMPDDLRCNGAKDCQFGEDEEECDAGKCSGKWACGDGSCIGRKAQCDGKKDCPDGSDETHVSCRNFTETRPENKFRCAYGAWVDASAQCDGAQDCADGSDELLARCRNDTLIVDGKFTCADGEQIPATNLCDGKEDCSNGWDETLATCAGFTCADANQFQCAYGACVDPESVCDADRNPNCADGSDEEDELCSRPTSKKCVLPPHPEHGTYSVTVGRRSEPPGAPNWWNVTLETECEPPYMPDGPVEAQCANGEWVVPVAECKQFCELPRHYSVIYYCGDRICNDFEPNGSEVRPKCINNYIPDIEGGQFSNMNCVFQNWNYIATCKLDISYKTDGNNFTIFIGGEEVVVRVSGTDYAVSVDHDSKTIESHKVVLGPNERVNEDPCISSHFNPGYFDSDQ